MRKGVGTVRDALPVKRAGLAAFDGKFVYVGLVSLVLLTVTVSLVLFRRSLKFRRVSRAVRAA